MTRATERPPRRRTAERSNYLQTIRPTPAAAPAQSFAPPLRSPADRRGESPTTTTKRRSKAFYRPSAPRAAGWSAAGSLLGFSADDKIRACSESRRTAGRCRRQRARRQLHSRRPRAKLGGGWKFQSMSTDSSCRNSRNSFVIGARLWHWTYCWQNLQLSGRKSTEREPISKKFVARNRCRNWDPCWPILSMGNSFDRIQYSIDAKRGTPARCAFWSQKCEVVSHLNGAADRLKS